MKNIHLLFLDHGISKSKTGKVISEKFNLSMLDFGDKFREQLSKIENELTSELQSFFNKGELAPGYMLKKLLKVKINEIVDQDILLFDFPKSAEHYSILKDLLIELDLKIQTIWYVKQRKPEKYMEDFFKNPIEKTWLDKYGNEVIEKWKNEFDRKRQIVSIIQNTTITQNWIVVEMDYEPNLSEEFILERINDCV